MNLQSYKLTDYNAEVTKVLKRPYSEYVLQAKSIYKTLDAYPIALLTENAGSGKSTTAFEFSNILRDENITAGTSHKMVFATNTRRNRNAFNQKSGFIIIRGIGEIIEAIVPNKAEVSQRIQEIYDDVEVDEKVDIVGDLLEEGLITEKQATVIRADIEANRQLIQNNNFITMTVAKLSISEFIKQFHGYYIFLDEMSYDKLLTVAGSCYVYNSQKEKQKNGSVGKLYHVEIDLALDSNGVDGSDTNGLVVTKDRRFFRLLQEISHITAAQREHVTGVTDDNQAIKGYVYNTKLVLMSAEKTLSAAFASCHAMKCRYKQVGQARTLYDDNLDIMIMRSTSNNLNETDTNRSKLAELAEKNGYTVIADGIGAKYNFENCKGSNEMQDMKLCTIVGLPAPEQVAHAMLALGVDEPTAISYIVSDKVNQALGRNTGYRSRGQKHLLIIPDKLFDSQYPEVTQLLKLDTISDNILDCRSRELTHKAMNLECIAIAREFYKSDEFAIAEVFAKAYNDLISKSGFQIPVKYFKNAIKDELRNLGIAETRIIRDKLVVRIVDALTEQKVIQKKRINTKEVVGQFYIKA